MRRPTYGPVRLGGLLCMAAGCLLLVFAVLDRERDLVRLLLGAALVVAGVTWITQARGPRE